RFAVGSPRLVDAEVDAGPGRSAGTGSARVADRANTQQQDSVCITDPRECAITLKVYQKRVMYVRTYVLDFCNRLHVPFGASDTPKWRPPPPTESAPSLSRYTKSGVRYVRTYVLDSLSHAIWGDQLPKMA